MTSLPAITGWHWVREGFKLNIKRPGQLTILFVAYTFFLFVIGLIPFIGQIVPPLLTPTFSMVIMTACAQIDKHSYVDHQKLRLSFEAPVLRRLLALGSLYVLMALISIGLVWLIFGGEISPFSQVDPKMMPDHAEPSRSWPLLLIALFGLLYVPLFWFAAPLIVWRQFGVPKAIFYSFYSVIRNAMAFIVFFVSWFVVGAMLPAMLSVVLTSMLGLSFLALPIVLLLSMALTIVMYCSCYASYKDIFGVPDLPTLSTT